MYNNNNNSTNEYYFQSKNLKARYSSSKKPQTKPAVTPPKKAHDIMLK